METVGSVAAQVVPEHAACPASDTRAHHGWANGSEFVAQEDLSRVVALCLHVISYIYLTGTQYVMWFLATYIITEAENI